MIASQTGFRNSFPRMGLKRRFPGCRYPILRKVPASIHVKVEPVSTMSSKASSRPSSGERRATLARRIPMEGSLPNPPQAPSCYKYGQFSAATRRTRREG